MIEILNYNFCREELPNYLKNNYFKTSSINILEIGVFEGLYASKIYEVFLDSYIYLLDTWNTSNTDFYYSVRNGLVEKAYSIAKSRFIDKKNVTFLIEDSKTAHKKYEDNFFDWIYVDGDHSYDGVMSDLINFYPKLKINGIFSGHDWDVDPGMNEASLFGVQKALYKFAEDKNIKLNLTNEIYHKSWFFEKF